MNRRQAMQMIGGSILCGNLALPVKNHDLSVHEFYDIEKRLVQDEQLGLAVKTNCKDGYSLVPYINCFQLIKFGVLEKRNGCVVESGPFIALFVRLTNLCWGELLFDILQKDQEEYTPLPMPIIYVQTAITPEQFKELKQAARYIAYSYGKVSKDYLHQNFRVCLLTVTPDGVQRHEMKRIRGLVSVERL